MEYGRTISPNGSLASAPRADESPWRQLRTSLVGRVSIAIGALSTILTLLLTSLGSPLIENYEMRRKMDYFDEMLNAFESTARIACYTGDSILAAEVTQGLATNPAVAAVQIFTGELLLAEKVQTPSHPIAQMQTIEIRRALNSPFDDRRAVGKIVLTLDRTFISALAARYSQWLIGILLVEAAIVTLFVALATLRIVVRPITLVVRDLREIEGRVDKPLTVPQGHESDEIGQLSNAFNRMIASAAALLDDARDMTDKIAQSEKRFRTLAENSPDIIARFSASGDLIFANPSCTRETGLEAGGAGAPIPPGAWRPAMRLEHFRAAVQQVAISGHPCSVHWEWERGSEPVCHEIHMVAEYNADGSLVGVLAIGRDISARRAAERLLLHESTHDSLTGLPNRTLFNDRLQQAIRQARREGRCCAVIFADLDDFKQVNDSLGHTVGDRLLQTVSQRMVRALRESDTVARQGGDEFVILIDDISTGADIETVLQKLSRAIGEPCEINGHTLIANASLGGAVFPDDGADADTLMRNADMAMYAAKEGGRGQYRLFRGEMSETLADWTAMSSDLRRAIENNELTLHYQPKVDLRSGEFTGMEALVRWHHPQRGAISPARFIPVAERNGLIGAIGDWVLHEACRQMRAWLDAGLLPRCVAVNLSATQCRGGQLPDHIGNALTRHGVPASFLEVEITESIMMEDAEESARVLWAVRDMGVKVSVDDFGTGYSSLSYLKKLPVDKLKIDKSFVDDIETDTNDVEIIKAIIAMAHSLDLSIVAEGVETSAQAGFLHAAGCEQIQGYLYSRPLSADDMTAWLSANDRTYVAAPPTQKEGGQHPSCLARELSAAMKNSPHPMWRYDPDCRRISANATFVGLSGQPIDEIIGKRPRDLQDTPSARHYEETIKGVIASGEPTELEYTWPIHDGSMMTSRVRFIPEFDGTGRVVSVLALGRDITRLVEGRNSLPLRNFAPPAWIANTQNESRAIESTAPARPNIRRDIGR